MIEQKVSEIIRQRIIDAGAQYKANDNIAEYINEGEMEALQAEVEQKAQELLQTLVIDTVNDHNTQETSKRLAKMYLREVFRGRYIERPMVTDFPNYRKLNEIYTLGPITVRSACSHHFVPITGQAWIGIIPTDKVIGISKFVRLTEWIMARPQIQEESAVMLADELEEIIKPQGLAIVIRAQHNCMTWRGVREHDTSMTTSVMRGVFLNDHSAKTEFLQIIGGQNWQ